VLKTGITGDVLARERRLREEMDALYALYGTALERLRLGDDSARLALRAVDALMSKRDAELLTAVEESLASAPQPFSPQLAPARGLSATRAWPSAS
jgi:hypothetical protein